VQTTRFRDNLHQLRHSQNIAEPIKTKNTTLSVQQFQNPIENPLKSMHVTPKYTSAYCPDLLQSIHVTPKYTIAYCPDLLQSIHLTPKYTIAYCPDLLQSIHLTPKYTIAYCPDLLQSIHLTPKYTIVTVLTCYRHLSE
jgi:hypothetical protein